jgi:tetratricopeptide (TPR) repeat protein
MRSRGRDGGRMIGAAGSRRSDRGLRLLALTAIAVLCVAPLARAGGQDDQKRAPVDRTTRGVSQPREQDRRPRKGVNLPSSPRAELDLAAGYIGAQEYERAIAVLERIAADSPQVVEANDMLATCYLKVGRAREAATLLESVVASEPERFSSIRNLGLAYLDMGEREKAVLAWRRMLRGGVQYGASYGVVAKLEQEAGLYDEAIATLREGLAIKEYRENYAREIIHLERVKGDEEAAFRDALLLAGQRSAAAAIDLRGPAIEIFGESKSPTRLLAVADSMVGAGGMGGERIRYLRIVLLVNGGRYREASEELFANDAAKPVEEDFYALIQYWGRSARTRGDDGFSGFYEGALRRFLRDHPSSILAPSVMLMIAGSRREAGERGGPSAEVAFREALSLADQAVQHRQGAPYREQAAIFGASVLLDDLHRPDEALARLDGAAWRNERFARGAAELRMRALLAVGDTVRTEQGLERLAGDRDSMIAVIGRYGLARWRFLGGRYGEAVRALSAFAERYPGSAWANDALETAIAVKESMEEERGALELYRAASIAGDRGEYGRALDSLAALESRFPDSKLAPRSQLMKVELEAALGDTSRAVADCARLAERFPLHELAPRALERGADLSAASGARDAVQRYGLVIERYPDYAFLDRVRGKYIALGKAAGAGTAGAARKGTE